MEPRGPDPGGESVTWKARPHVQAPPGPQPWDPSGNQGLLWAWVPGLSLPPSSQSWAGDLNLTFPHRRPRDPAGRRGIFL